MSTKQQRVNVQYSVKLEEVPKLVLELLREVHSNLEQAIPADWFEAIQTQATDYQNYSYGASKINELRLLLAEADYRLSDCQAMLTGLAQLEASGDAAQPELPDIENRVSDLEAATAVTAEYTQPGELETHSGDLNE